MLAVTLLRIVSTNVSRKIHHPADIRKENRWRTRSYSFTIDTLRRYSIESRTWLSRTPLYLELKPSSLGFVNNKAKLQNTRPLIFILHCVAIFSLAIRTLLMTFCPLPMFLLRFYKSSQHITTICSCFVLKKPRNISLSYVLASLKNTQRINIMLCCCFVLKKPRNISLSYVVA